MAFSLEYLQEVADLIGETANLRVGRLNEVHRAVYLLGLTRHNFVLEVKYLLKDSRWALRVFARRGKDDLLQEVMEDLCDCSEFCVKESVRVVYQFTSPSVEELVEQAQILTEFVQDNGLGEGKASESVYGVSFAGTQFDRLKERGATISGMFGNLVCQASGMNLLMMQAEYYVDAGEIDGVEFDEDGSVISIYECQSGIHKGNELDDEHTAKALGTYLYDPEIIPTVRKVVILAGAYSEGDMVILRERAYELSRRERAIELVVLITTRVDNRIGVERVVL